MVKFCKGFAGFLFLQKHFALTKVPLFMAKSRDQTREINAEMTQFCEGVHEHFKDLVVDKLPSL